MKKINVLVWDEDAHGNRAAVEKHYPRGIHGCIADFLSCGDMDVKTATFALPEYGLTKEILDNTDVLIWWGHLRHQDVADEIVERVHERILQGMGLIVLHSGHASKIFRKICGTNSQTLKWRENGEKEILWVIEPSHPIVDGLEEKIIIPEEETYGERFEIARPDELVFISWFEGGEVFRSGCCYYRGKGKIFYFQPGHETNPTYLIPEIQKVISNAVKWAAPVNSPTFTSGNVKPVV